MSPAKYLSRRRAEKAAEQAVTDCLRAFEEAARSLVSTVRFWPSETLHRVGASLLALEAAGNVEEAANVRAWLEEFIADEHGVETLRALAALHLGPLVVGEAGAVLDGLEVTR